MKPLVLGCWVLCAAVPAAGSDDAPRKAPLEAPAHGEDDTQCGACHTVNNWTEVVFPHERTGFPLRQAHAKTACKACHPVDFVQHVPDTCGGCHRDVHRGELGAHCQSCHDEATWRTTFSADAHRATNFPLSGRHAVIPCESCHGALRDQAFVRPTTDCSTCHWLDYQKTVGGPIDHNVLQFGTQCRSCHDTARFFGARYARHEDCFQLIGGPHTGIECFQCHSTLGPVNPVSRCATHTAVCTSCHDHAQARTDSQHPSVPGYQYKDIKCYQCHRFSTAP